MNNYVFILNEKGERITAIVDNMITPAGESALIAQAKAQYPDAAQYIYKEDGDAMLDNFMAGQIYKDGAMVEPEPYVPTADETQAASLAQIDSEYGAQLDDLKEQIIVAATVDQDNAYADELRQQRQTLQAEYIEKRGAL